MASRSSISKYMVWVLMGMLILGLGGFGVTNLSGTIRSVGKVGDVDINIAEYARALQNEIRAYSAQTGQNVSFAQAQAVGIDTLVLSQLIATTALEDETAKMGISIGDKSLRDEILNIPSFQGLDGKFDRASYTFALEQVGLNEAQFEADMRAEAARTLLQGAVVSGVSAPGTFVDTLLNFLGERRDITWAVLERGDLLAGVPMATEEELRAYHQSNLPDFTSPEIKDITYVWLTPAMILDTVEVDQATLREAYEDRIEEFNQPERRFVERLAFLDRSSADAALAAVTDGTSNFEDLVTARGLTLEDVDLGDVTLTQLEDAGEAVFAAEAGDIVGPIETDLGPALYRINGILAAQNTSFEEAAPSLRDTLAADRARRVVDSQIDGIDDLFAGGATLEEVASETELQLGSIAWHPDVSDDIGAYIAFRTAADSVTENDFPSVIPLEDGGIFAMRLNRVVEPTIQPLQDVRDAVTSAWQTQSIRDALRAQAEPQVAKLSSGKRFEDLGFSNVLSTTDLMRSSFQPDTPANFIETVFSMSQDEVQILDGNGRVFVLRLDLIKGPDPAAEDIAALQETLEDRLANDISQDLFQALADDIRSRAGIELDQQALNAVHANFQ